jgi:hypothetical protein
MFFFKQKAGWTQQFSQPKMPAECNSELKLPTESNNQLPAPINRL